MSRKQSSFMDTKSKLQCRTGTSVFNSKYKVDLTKLLSSHSSLSRHIVVGWEKLEITK